MMGPLQLAADAKDLALEVDLDRNVDVVRHFATGYYTSGIIFGWKGRTPKALPSSGYDRR